MVNRFLCYSFLLVISAALPSCKKWEDKQAPTVALPNRYCNLVTAINYNQGFPGVEDSTVCIFPSQPFLGTYSFQDSVYTEGDELPKIGALINFKIEATSRIKMSLVDFCNTGKTLYFTANRYYRAVTDSILVKENGFQLMCRNEDTLIGTMDFRPLDSSLFLDLKVISDTGTSFHRGRAYKK